MKIRNIHIENFKSLVDIEINEPNPFSVFVGPNGSGKSNIFQAIEFGYFFSILDFELALRILEPYFGTSKPLNTDRTNFIFKILFGEGSVFASGDFNNDNDEMSLNDKEIINGTDFEFFKKAFSRIFIKPNFQLQASIKFGFSNKTLERDASNMESVLSKILLNSDKREEIIDWLALFIPEFKNIEIQTSKISGFETLLIFEKSSKKPFTKNLISDGTYNILSLLTAVFQSDEPQFLCIEEPENGLHPYVIRELVKFFRQQCEEKGHYIWLNTHSQTLVDELQPHEIILVDKKDGATQIKQFSKDKNLHGLKMDFAWLSNSLGGGVPW